MFSTLCFRSICFVLVSSTTLIATDIDVPVLQKTIYATIESVTPAVVSVVGPGGVDAGGGFSGVIVSKDGHILSAGHAVRPGVAYQVLLPDGRRFKARGKGSNPVADCALLQITTEEDNLPYVRMGESKSLVKNQPCLSISYPSGQKMGLAPVVRFGRFVRDGGGRGMLQSTAAMEPGDSGGPLFDLGGRVVGIHSRIRDGMDQNFDIPVDTFKKFWSELNREKSFRGPGPTLPTLGVRTGRRRGGKGVHVRAVVSDSLADKHGIKPNDVIESVHGVETRSMRFVRNAMLAAKNDDTQEILVKILRDKEQIELKIPFEFENDLTEVALPNYENNELPKPTGFDQLANLPKEFSDLESELDDACVNISSTKTDDKKLSIVGTRIKATPFIISKNSMVGENPTVKDQPLEVVARDNENDLVLLKAPIENTDGIDISTGVDNAPKTGSFLITPDSNGAGLVSVVSTQSFTSPKERTRGFLGVTPADHVDKAGAILEAVANGGAAKRAGLKVGDIVTKLNDTPITDQSELRKFLGTIDPGMNIVATITRDEKELKKTFKLGSRTNHVADGTPISVRRNGFSKIMLHDADLKPTNCGGPVFDLNGNFVGLNIARHSRVRSYLIPRTIVKQLVETTN